MTRPHASAVLVQFLLHRISSEYHQPNDKQVNYTMRRVPPRDTYANTNRENRKGERSVCRVGSDALLKGKKRSKEWGGISNRASEVGTMSSRDYWLLSCLSFCFCLRASMSLRVMRVPRRTSQCTKNGCEKFDLMPIACRTTERVSKPRGCLGAIRTRAQHTWW